MARLFSMISPDLWTSKTFRSMSDDARYCYLYFLTSEHNNSAGAYRLPPAYAAHDLNWDVERYVHSRTELSNSGMIILDEDSDELFILKWLKHNKPMNPKHRIGTVSILEKLESNTVYEVAMAELEEVSPEEKFDQTTGEVIPYNPNLASKQSVTEFVKRSQGKSW